MNNRNLEHDEQVKPVDRDPALVVAAREAMALSVKKPGYVTDILDGKWDETPLFRKAYGEAWQASKARK